MIYQAEFVTCAIHPLEVEDGCPGRDEVVEVELHHDGETWRQLQLHEVEELLEGLDVGGHELTKNNFGLNAVGSIKSQFKLREMLTQMTARWY